MNQYINRSDVLDTIGVQNNRIWNEVYDLPVADVAPVRHGRWIDEIENPVPWDECNSKCPSHSAYCSECGEWLTASDEYPVTGLYCPNCGALMDKEDDNE